MSSNKENCKRKSRCQVRNCTRNPNASMHQLSDKKNPKIKKMWIEALQLTSDCFDRVYVCGDHFIEQDFRRGLSRQRLHDWAVPTFNLPPKERIKLEKVKTLKRVDEKLMSSVGQDSSTDSYVNENQEVRSESLADDVESSEFILGL